MKQQLADYIRNSITVTDDELTLILSFFRPMNPRKNELIVTVGQVGQRMHFICKGCLRVFFIQEDGQDATRHIAFENSFASGMVGFITQQPSLEFIQALEPSELLCISRNDFYHLLSVVPTWEKFYRHYLEFAYVNNTNRLMSFITMSAIERYRQLLEENPVVVQRLPNKIVASYLNISQETLSRIKSKI